MPGTHLHPHLSSKPLLSLTEKMVTEQDWTQPTPGAQFSGALHWTPLGTLLHN